MENTVKKVIAKVISQNGTCKACHQVGDQAEFTELGVDG